MDFCFKGDDKQFKSVRKYDAKYINCDKQESITFSQSSLKGLSNAFPKTAFSTWKQNIPTNCFNSYGIRTAPLFENILLFSSWTKKIKKNETKRTRKFANGFRFIVDLVLNKGDEFERYFQEIYPLELELKKNDMNAEHSLLYLCIKTNDDRFSIGLYEKRDDFTFSIVRMPDLRSIILSKILYSVFGEQPLRIAQTTSKYNKFKTTSKG